MAKKKKVNGDTPVDDNGAVAVAPAPVVETPPFTDPPPVKPKKVKTKKAKANGQWNFAVLGPYVVRLTEVVSIERLTSGESNVQLSAGPQLTLNAVQTADLLSLLGAPDDVINDPDYAGSPDDPLASLDN